MPAGRVARRPDVRPFHPDGHAVAASHVRFNGAMADLSQAMQKNGEPLTAQGRFAAFSALVEDLAATDWSCL